VRKHAAIAELRPDVLVIPEAGRLDALSNVIGAPPVRSCKWIGDKPAKGIGVVSYGEYSLRVHEAYEPRHRWILPLEVDGPTSFILFAVWTVPHEKTGYYVSCLFEALETYRALLTEPRVVWAGDFNQSTAFDSPSDPLHFSHWLSKAERFGLRSLYHLHARCEHGAEPDKTFFLHHSADKPHHIDYIFAKPALFERGLEFAVGDHRTWSKLSDHMPLTFATPA
jgi:Endonuclease/Exonuclease/phosphatase family